MNSIQRAIFLISIGTIGLSSLNLYNEASAQTLLTGNIQNSASMPRLIKQTPVLDTTYVQVPTSSPPRTATYQSRATKYVVVKQPVIQRVYVKDNRTFFQRHPKVKAATVGAGVGAAAGAVTGLISGRGVVRGGLIGAGTGAGVGLVRSSDTLKRHPIVRDVATGGLVGLGLGAAASRRSKRVWQGAGVGSAAGLAYGLLKHGLR